MSNPFFLRSWLLYLITKVPATTVVASDTSTVDHLITYHCRLSTTCTTGIGRHRTTLAQLVAPLRVVRFAPRMFVISVKDIPVPSTNIGVQLLVTPDS